MVSLETLDASRNQLTEIPVQLSKSRTLSELFFNDNYLTEIPPRIMSMPSLKILEAESK